MRAGLFAVLVSICLSAVAAGGALAACSDTTVELRGDFGSVRFRAAIADTPAERAQGLMHVAQMPRMSGMLFVYERPQSVSFWMENTLIPLDMIFADAAGVVRRIHANAVPLDRTPIPGGPGIQYVLEINGGMAANLGLSEGNQMRHPAMNQDVAAWPCVSQ